MKRSAEFDAIEELAGESRSRRFRGPEAIAPPPALRTVPSLAELAARAGTLSSLVMPASPLTFLSRLQSPVIPPEPPSLLSLPNEVLLKILGVNQNMVAVHPLDLVSVRETSKRLKYLAGRAFSEQLQLSNKCYEIDVSAAALQLVSVRNHCAVIKEFGKYINGVKLLEYNGDYDIIYENGEFIGLPTKDITVMIDIMEALVRYAFKTPDANSTLIIRTEENVPMTNAFETIMSTIGCLSIVMGEPEVQFLQHLETCLQLVDFSMNGFYVYSLPDSFWRVKFRALKKLMCAVPKSQNHLLFSFFHRNSSVTSLYMFFKNSWIDFSFMRKLKIIEELCVDQKYVNDKELVYDDTTGVDRLRHNPVNVHEIESFASLRSLKALRLYGMSPLLIDEIIDSMWALSLKRLIISLNDFLEYTDEWDDQFPEEYNRRFHPDFRRIFLKIAKFPNLEELEILGYYSDEGDNGGCTMYMLSKLGGVISELIRTAHNIKSVTLLFCDGFDLKPVGSVENLCNFFSQLDDAAYASFENRKERFILYVQLYENKDFFNVNFEEGNYRAIRVEEIPERPNDFLYRNED